ncbi:hypothetical protein HLB42_07690 [Deinococcus sp. D7000]|nr:hypothetical protein HLB42_07690 [Deinococcus sp. D7000]
MIIPLATRPSDLSYLGLRATIGFVGVLMPIVVWFIGWLYSLDPRIYDTVSAHYYSQARDIFVGSMALIGMLIYFYQSPDKADIFVAKITGVAGILIGIMPMAHKPEMAADYQYTLFENLHLYPVTIFFLGGIYLVLFSFRKTVIVRLSKNMTLSEMAPDMKGKGKKLLRNQIYLGCGIIMSLGGLVLALANYLEPSFMWWAGWRYYPETAMIVAFAIAWLVKGQTFKFIRD